MSKYELIWKHGDSQIVEGRTVEEALNNAGIGAGAVRALDYYKTLEKDPDFKEMAETLYYTLKRIPIGRIPSELRLDVRDLLFEANKVFDSENGEGD